MHLSRLWTDTQVRKAAVVIGSNWTLVGQGTGAPVTSMDRHTSTKATVVKRSKTKPWLSKVRVHLSRLWTDTQVRKATVAKMSKLNLGWTRYECTCHVYGQTHKYEKQQWWKCPKKRPGLVEVQVRLSRLWTDTRVQLEKRIWQNKRWECAQIKNRVSLTKKKEVRVHLPRLWTDTQVQNS